MSKNLKYVFLLRKVWLWRGWSRWSVAFLVLAGYKHDLGLNFGFCPTRTIRAPCVVIEAPSYPIVIFCRPRPSQRKWRRKKTAHIHRFFYTLTILTEKNREGIAAVAIADVMPKLTRIVISLVDHQKLQHSSLFAYLRKTSNIFFTFSGVMASKHHTPKTEDLILGKIVKCNSLFVLCLTTHNTYPNLRRVHDSEHACLCIDFTTIWSHNISIQLMIINKLSDQFGLAYTNNVLFSRAPVGFIHKRLWILNFKTFSHSRKYE